MYLLFLAHKKNNSYVFTFIVLETAVLLGISTLQFFYIKRLLKNN